jgi:hypothetical protein
MSATRDRERRIMSEASGPKFASQVTGGDSEQSDTPQSLSALFM